ncbi:MAG: DUF6290 family protein [Christensenella sp.]
MAHISLRVSDMEKIAMDNYAKLHGMNLSDAIKEAFFEKLEDEYDLRVIEEYEKNKAGMKFYTMDEAKKELGLNDESI